MTLFTRSFDDHFGLLTTVLSLMRDAVFSLKIKKCFFVHAKLDYLRHIICPYELRVQPRIFEAVWIFK